MRIKFLYNKIAWFGQYSGYEYLGYLFDDEKVFLYNASKNSLYKRIIGKIIQIKTRNFKQTTFGLATAFRFLNANNNSIKHILYLGNHLYLIEVARENTLKKLVGTIHLPFSQWTVEKLTSLKNLKYCIFLYQEEIEKFKPYLPNASVTFIRHGVNNDFFKPQYYLKEKNKILCVGHYLRDFELLGTIYQRLKVQNPHLNLHLIIPKHQRQVPALQHLAVSDGVYFHEKLSDQELLRFYQSSSLLLMPMIDSGANTAIVQAIACGLPIVTTNVGGIKSYGGGEIYPVFNKNESNDLLNYIQTLLDDEQVNKSTSVALRNFSLNFLDWKKIKQEHLMYYQSLNLK